MAGGRPKGIWTPDIVRQRIQTTKLAKALQDHVFGKNKMTSTQVRAAEVLLARTLPTLTQTELNVDGQLGTYDISDKPLTAEQWAAQAEDYMGAAAGTAKAPN
jgi:hypothetical protein